MVAQPQIPTFTVEEYLAMEEVSDTKHEYVDGYIYAMSGGTIDHDTVANNVRGIMRAHLAAALAGGGTCRPHGPDVQLHCSPTVYYYPDAIVTCAGIQVQFVGQDKQLRDAQLVVEVISPTTATRDRGEKFANYQRLPSFAEYLLVDGGAKAAERFHREADGSWSYHRYAQGDAITLDTIGLTAPLDDFYLFTTL